MTSSEEQYGLTRESFNSKDEQSMIESGVYRYELDRGSHEYFSPGPLSTQRTGTPRSAMLTLVGTIIGGGVLSLPYAFDKSGLILAIVFTIISAVSSNFTLYIIVSSSRRGGVMTYEQMVRKALGARAGLLTVILLVMITFLTLVAYIILVKDLIGTLAAQFIFQRVLSTTENNILTIMGMSLVSRFLFARSMHALRFTTIFSMCSVMMLAVSITIRALFSSNNSLSPEAMAVPIKWWPTSWKDAVYAFPIISVSYLCHFNVLPVYRELQKPTRRRLKNIISCTMASTWFFYIVVGFTGYFFAYRLPGGVKDDILNNFKRDDHLVNVGRLGLVTTILLSMPLIIQPCRSNTIRLSEYIRGLTESDKSGELKPLKAPTEKREPPISTVLNPDTVHIVLTIVILLSTISLAFALPGVAVVWNLMGSTVGLLVSYVLPSVSYAVIRKNKPHTDRRRLTAWIIFGFSSVVCLACSIQACLGIIGVH